MYLHRSIWPLMTSPEVESASGAALRSIGKLSWITFRLMPINRKVIVNNLPFNTDQQERYQGQPSDQYRATNWSKTVFLAFLVPVL